MKCPHCQAESRVLETRVAHATALRRSRICEHGHRFKTVEIVAAEKAPRPIKSRVNRARAHLKELVA